MVVSTSVTAHSNDTTTTTAAVGGSFGTVRHPRHPHHRNRSSRSLRAHRTLVGSHTCPNSSTSSNSNSNSNNNRGVNYRQRSTSLSSESGSGVGARGYVLSCDSPSQLKKKISSPAVVALSKTRCRNAQRMNDMMVYLDGPQVYTCNQCRTHLSSHDDIISKSFHGRHGEYTCIGTKMTNEQEEKRANESNYTRPTNKKNLV